MGILLDLIRQTTSLPQNSNPAGFYTVACKLCNDHIKKGKRAGFKEIDGGILYNCFNCGHTAVQDLSTSTTSKPMVEVLDAYDVSLMDWKRVLSSTSSHMGESKLVMPASAVTYPSPINPPPYFTQLAENGDDSISLTALEYLQSRHINFNSSIFYIITPETAKTATSPMVAKLLGRLIIPFFYRGEMVYWQARDMFDIHDVKYMSPGISKHNLLSRYDFTDSDSTSPLYVTEGWFDAVSISGVAVFGSKITNDQKQLLNATPRPKVAVLDKYGDGFMMGAIALRAGWGISTPDLGDCKDVNEAICKYGKMFVQKQIVDGTTTDSFVAKTRIQLYCNINYDKANKTATKVKKMFTEVW